VGAPKCTIGDKAYDSAELREELDELGTKPVIPNRSNRKQPFSFNKLKDFRRIATRRPIGALLSRLGMPRGGSCMLEAMSLDPSRGA
jgi:hypothetical protein